MKSTKESPFDVIDQTSQRFRERGGHYLIVDTDIGIQSQAIKSRRKDEWTVWPPNGAAVKYPPDSTPEWIIEQMKRFIKLAIIGLMEDVRQETEREAKMLLDTMPVKNAPLPKSV